MHNPPPLFWLGTGCVEDKTLSMITLEDQKRKKHDNSRQSYHVRSTWKKKKLENRDQDIFLCCFLNSIWSVLFLMKFVAILYF